VQIPQTSLIDTTHVRTLMLICINGKYDPANKKIHVY